MCVYLEGSTKRIIRTYRVSPPNVSSPPLDYYYIITRDARICFFLAGYSSMTTTNHTLT